MGRLVFSIPSKLIVPSGTAAAAALTGAHAPPRGPSGVGAQARATLQWETADGRATGTAIDLDAASSILLEFPGTGGRMSWTDAPTSPTFSDEPPQDAAGIRLSIPGRAPVRIPRSALTAQPAMLPMPQVERFGPADANFVVPVFSERFVTRDDFTDRVSELHEAIIGQAPFDREPTRSQIALLAHFWPSDPDVGLFNTPDAMSQGGRLFFGDRGLAQTLLQPFVGTAPVSLILINSAMRGGAGGQPGFSAWTSITSAPGEDWQNVCLHEVGHGLGLADEYLDPNLATQSPTILEPNVSRASKPSETPWRDLINLPDAPAPSFALDQQALAPPTAIGTFAGARYRSDMFRSSLNCLMRDTTQRFCIVCQKHIEKVLSTPLIS